MHRIEGRRTFVTSFTKKAEKMENTQGEVQEIPMFDMGYNAETAVKEMLKIAEVSPKLERQKLFYFMADAIFEIGKRVGRVEARREMAAFVSEIQTNE